MGAIMSQLSDHSPLLGVLWRMVFLSVARRRFNIMLLGPNGSGKSTVRLHLAHQELEDQKPASVTPSTPAAQGFMFAGARSKNGFRVQLWDTSYDESNKSIVQHYLEDCEGVLFVLDSSQRKHYVKSAANMLSEYLFRPEDRKKPVLVVANKQDLSDAADCHTISEMMGLRALGFHNVTVLPATAISGEGLDEALSELCRSCDERRRKQLQKAKHAATTATPRKPRATTEFKRNYRAQS